MVQKAKLTGPGPRSGAPRRFAGLVLIFYLLARPLPILAGHGAHRAIEMEPLSRRLASLRERVQALAGEGDLIDTLYFSWFDRPDARATLAILVKTTRALQRELDLRELGNAAIPDTNLREMLDWADEALERVVGSAPDTRFRPHRLRAAHFDLNGMSATPPLYAFVDSTTATRRHELFGDLDLLAAMGQRIYPRHLNDLLVPKGFDRLVDRAVDLGMAVIGTASRSDSDLVPIRRMVPGVRPVRTLRPTDLRGMLEGSPPRLENGQQLMVVSDPAGGESWSASLARRALARGVSGGRRFVAVDWNPPVAGVREEDRTGLTTAAMWIHAIEGQSLGLIRGWRDLRDGSVDPYPSLLVSPGRTEAIAHSALDLLRLGSYLARFSRMPIVAIAAGPEAVAGGDNNEWAGWIEPIWSGLLRRQVRFDVVNLDANPERIHKQYQVVFPLGRGDVDEVDSVLLRMERSLARHSEHTDRVTVRESDGTLAGDVFVREGRTKDGRRCVAVVNLSGRSRNLRLDGFPIVPSRDLVADIRIERPGKRVPFGPWQVRLLWPVK